MLSQMKYKLAYFLFLIFVLNSCKNDNQKRLIENQKEAQKREVIFANIDKGWIFNASPINASSRAKITTWNEWRQFLSELDQKPKKTIGAFQKKSKELSKKVMALNDNIPVEYNLPQIKSRIATLITKVRMLDLFINLDNIPDKKVIILVSEINAELVSLENQMDKIAQKSQIPLEEGESELMKMLDTTRAIPNVKVDKNIPRVE